MLPMEKQFLLWGQALWPPAGAGAVAEACAAPSAVLVCYDITLAVCWWCAYYMQWCEQDRRCHRLLLTDLLIAPMQLCTKVPLLLNNILQHTVDPLDKLHLSACLEALEKSLSK